MSGLDELAASDGALRRIFATRISKKGNLVNIHAFPGSVGMETRIHQRSCEAELERKTFSFLALWS